MKKRLISAVLAVCIAIGLLPMGAAAEGTGDEGLPVIGFYTAQTRSEENYIEETDRSEALVEENYNYLEHNEGERVVWLLTEDGFSEDTVPSVKLSWASWGWDDDGEQIYINDEIPITAEQVLRPGSDPAVYDYRFDLKCIKESLTAELTHCRADRCMLLVNIDNYTAVLFINLLYYEDAGIPVGEDYIVTFYREDSPTGNVFNSGSWLPRGFTIFNERTENVEEEKVGVLQRKKDEDGNYYYVVAKDNQVQMTVDRVWIEHVMGEEGAASLAEDSLVLELNELNNGVLTVYENEKRSYDWLFLEATITYQGIETTARLGWGIDSMNTNYVINIYRGENDTVAAVEAALRDAYQANPEGSYTLYLGNTTYQGVITVPAGMKLYNIEGCHSAWGEKTIIQGGIEYESDECCPNISYVHFQGTDEAESAVMETGMSAMWCSFTGYKVAVGNDKYSQLASMGNVFIDNEVALLVDFGGNGVGVVGSPVGNTFLGNKTAVKITSLGGWFTPYALRIIGCNFINNETDFDVYVPGTFYFNGNYFGGLKYQGTIGWGNWSDLEKAVTQTSVNAVIGRKGAIIKKTSGTTVVTDIVQKYPILDWWMFLTTIEDVFNGSGASATFSTEYEERYTNCLLTDWLGTVRLASDSTEEMILDPSAFEEAGEKEISVVDQDENVLGTWSFD